MLSPDFPIRTERLTLRPYGFDDLVPALTYWSREDVTRYLYLGPYTRADFAERLAVLAGRTELAAEEDVLTLAIVPDGVDHVVGDVTLFWRSEQHQTAEIGFILHPDHQGQGYAREASIPLLRMGFEQLGLHRMIGRLDARNVPSAAVLRRLGMRQEAHLIENEWVKGEWTDELVFAMLRDEWQQLHGAGLQLGDLGSAT
jgi:RimJ/RimL family protein N-acetyltransferase